MEYLSTKYGLVTDEDPTTENGQLFLAQYCLLLYEPTQYYFSQSSVVAALDTMTEQLQNSYTGIPGLYHRNPDLTDRRIMSHDNIIGIMCWSKFFNTSHRFDIWNYLVKHGGLYDNTQGKSPQFSKYLPYSPQTMFILGLCANSKLIYLFFPLLFPIFLLNLIWDCYKKPEESTSKLIDWVTFVTLRNIWFMKPLNKFFVSRMKKQYGENYIVGLMNTFHGRNSKEFPINKLLGIGV
jgi:hypothetical protein